MPSKKRPLLILILLILILILLLILNWLCRGGEGSDDDQPVGPAKVVFVTGDTYTGNFGGLAAADAVCQDHADRAGLSGNFAAWISGREESGQDVAGRMTHSTDPYRLVDGTQIAADWSDLTDGSLAAPIDKTETGSTVPAGSRVWTNTTPNGFAWDNTRDCALGGGPSTWVCDPTTECPFESGKWGLADRIDGAWTGQESSNEACSNQYRLYCFEQ